MTIEKPKIINALQIVSENEILKNKLKKQKEIDEKTRQENIDNYKVVMISLFVMIVLMICLNIIEFFEYGKNIEKFTFEQNRLLDIYKILSAFFIYFIAKDLINVVYKHIKL